MRAKLASLSDDMTVACLVPNITSEHEAKKYGILKENIIIWDTSCAKGIDEIGANINKATDLFFNNRAAGIKTKHLFKLDTSNLNQDVVLQNLQQLDPTTYNIYDVADTGPIKPYVESITGKPYVIGNVFYRLDKTETIQAKKDIFILEKTTGKVFGGDNARRLLSMPLDQEINVKPDANTLFDIYVESTSVNRKLFKDSKILVIS